MKTLFYLFALSVAGALFNCSGLINHASSRHPKTEGFVSQTKPVSNTASIVIPDNPVCTDEKINIAKDSARQPGSFSIPENNVPVIPPVKKNPSSAQNGKPKTIYTIQLLAVIFPHPVHSPIFKGRKIKEKYSDVDHLYRYYTGNFKSKEKAMLEAAKIQSDFPGAFILAVSNGKEVPVSEKEIIAVSEKDVK